MLSHLEHKARSAGSYFHLKSIQNLGKGAFESDVHDGTDNLCDDSTARGGSGDGGRAELTEGRSAS